jgi:hypothetical protein
MTRKGTPELSNVAQFDSLFMLSFIFPFYLSFQMNILNKNIAQKLIYDEFSVFNNLIVSLQYFFISILLIIILNLFKPFRFFLGNHYININSEYG